MALEVDWGSNFSKSEKLDIEILNYFYIFYLPIILFKKPGNWSYFLQIGVVGELRYTGTFFF